MRKENFVNLAGKCGLADLKDEVYFKQFIEHKIFNFKDSVIEEQQIALDKMNLSLNAERLITKWD